MKKRKKNPKLPHVINLVVGDWSGDGHMLTETITISSNLEKRAVERAYKRGCKKLGLQLKDEVARKWQDNLISKEQWDKLAKAGLTLQELFVSGPCCNSEVTDALEHLDENEGFSIYPDSYACMWLFVAHLGDPSFKHAFTKADDANINVGGYGLLDN